MKVARTVLSGGKDGDNFKVLPIATVQESLQFYAETAGNRLSYLLRSCTARRSAFRFERVKPGRDRLAGSMCNTKKIIRKGEREMNKDIQFLKELQQELKTQEIDCQAAPRFWTLMDYKWVVTAEGHHDRISLFFMDDCKAVIVEEYIEDIISGQLEHELTEERIEELKEMREYESEEGLVEWIKENIDDDCYLIYEEEVSFIVQDTMFLTKEDAKKHIEDNGHHYTKQVHTYAMTAWRSPKVERLLNILEIIDWESISTK
ncbi:hypothetical protein JDS77_25560 [Bacillus cereus group sp. N28]|uniref:hypothetical protein n=2 Tax=Bacillaceae TaxID=186817 RepID=UPI0018F5F2DD|nr:hypothetical protein [Bacillus cereus group sp. N28]MBJ7961020.1 hypothetical protein [Bacillus cereus group sp. N28]